jgi:prepilin signal peptidase PulO-like enzyme (type II secretory pathway)
MLRRAVFAGSFGDRSSAELPAWIAGASSGVLVLASFAYFGATVHAAVGALFFVVLGVVTNINLRPAHLIPNTVVLPAAAFLLLVQTIRSPSVEWIGAGLGAVGLLLLVAILSPDLVGMGSAKLAGLIGIVVGWTVFMALVISFVVGAFWSAALFARHGDDARKMAVPFAPALAIGGALVFFLGEPLNWFS